MKVTNDHSPTALYKQNRANVPGTARPAAFRRAAGDAFAIAQISRAVIQKAMQAAALLKNVAGQALASESVNSAKFEAAVNTIPQEITPYGVVSSGSVEHGLMSSGVSDAAYRAITDMIMDIEEGRAQPPDVSNIRKFIENNPSASLKAQGNIDRTAAMRHLR